MDIALWWPLSNSLHIGSLRISIHISIYIPICIYNFGERTLYIFFFRNTVLSFTNTTNIMAEYNTIYYFTFHGSGVWTRFSSVLCSGFPIKVLPRAGVSSEAQDSLSSSHGCRHNSLPSSHKTYGVMVLYGQQETDYDHRKRSRPFF